MGLVTLFSSTPGLTTFAVMPWTASVAASALV